MQSIDGRRNGGLQQLQPSLNRQNITDHCLNYMCYFAAMYMAMSTSFFLGLFNNIEILLFKLQGRYMNRSPHEIP